MKRNLERTVEIPSGIEVSVKGKNIIAKGSGKEISREFEKGKVEMEVKEGKFVIGAKNASRRESKMIGTIWAHFKNMLKGINEDFVYELEVCNVHFPMNVKVEGENLVIKSFLGEKDARYAKILPNVKVDVKGNKVTVTSYDVEAAGQTAANIEKATRLTGRDRRIFQDGIFITSKCGRII